MEDSKVKAAYSEILSNRLGSITENDLENYSVYELRIFLISKGVTVGSIKKIELLKLAEAAILSVGLTENVDFHDYVLDLSDLCYCSSVRFRFMLLFIRYYCYLV